MRGPDISAQTTPPNVLELNDFSNLPPGRASLPNLKKSADLSGTAQPGPTLGPAPDDD